MSIVDFAKEEMNIAWPESDEMQDMVKENVLELMSVFQKQGHSGFSAPYVLNIFSMLAMHKPITPLTGDDSEWNDVGNDVYQNNRCAAVFMDGKDGDAYWLDGNIFRDQNGCTFTNGYSRVKVVFPWVMPEPKIIDVFFKEQ